MDVAIYDAMSLGAQNLATDRGVALHKLARLATLATAGHGYLNFMGNEFGHPEWIDFPREGNRYSYRHARRQWHLRDDPALYFHCLAELDREILALARTHNLLEDEPPRKLWLSEPDKVFVFQRNDLIFLFNFQTQVSLKDYAVLIPPGRYRGVLDTDEKRFGGQARITPNQEYPVASEMRGAERCLLIRVYLPCRTALVLQREA